MAKKLSKKRTTSLTNTTSKIYSKVCQELGTSIEKLREQISYGTITPEEAQDQKEKIDALYCERICKLNSELLADFLDAHANGQFKRAPRTIDLVQKELLERVINEDNKGNDC